MYRFLPTILSGMVLASSPGNCSAAGGTNLLPNGDFSTVNQIANWTGTDSLGTMQWSSDDAAGDPNSGSIELDLNQTGGGHSVASACFAVDANDTYSYGGMGENQSFGSAAAMQCFQFSTPDCTGTATALGNGIGPPVFSAWAAFSSGANTLGPTAASVQCNLSVNNFPQTLAASRFDQLFFNSGVTTPVRLQSFDVR